MRQGGGSVRPIRKHFVPTKSLRREASPMNWSLFFDLILAAAALMTLGQLAVKYRFID
jgi:hypothetical protein